jgi:hypothetical protein
MSANTRPCVVHDPTTSAAGHADQSNRYNEDQRVSERIMIRFHGDG